MPNDLFLHLDFKFKLKLNSINNQHHLGAFMQNLKLDDIINKIIEDLNLDEQAKAQVMRNFSNLNNKKVNILITGATGVGKSSTINALFDNEKAKVGRSPNPETQHIQRYEFGNLILWDSPGLGDGREADIKHSKGIINKLLEKDQNGDLLIDLILVLLDGGTRDLGTSYELINHVIIPNLGEDKSRLLIAINQCDRANNGRGWDREKCEPNSDLINFLNDKVNSVKSRIKEATGVDVNPIYYSAGDLSYGEKPYNLSKLLALILQSTKPEKRLIFKDKINKQKELWEKDDRLKNYQEEVEKSFIESFIEFIVPVVKFGKKLYDVITDPIGTIKKAFFG